MLVIFCSKNVKILNTVIILDTLSVVTKSNMVSVAQIIKGFKMISFGHFLEGICHWALILPSSKAAIYWLVVMAGLFIHEFLPLPQSYLSNNRNVFNIYFYRLSWGWTLGRSVDSLHFFYFIRAHFLSMRLRC